MGYLDFIPKNLRPITASDAGGQHIVHAQHLTHDAAGHPTGYALDQRGPSIPGRDAYGRLVVHGHHPDPSHYARRGYNGAPRQRYGQSAYAGGPPVYGVSVLALDLGVDDDVLQRACDFNRQGRPRQGYTSGGKYYPSPLDNMGPTELQMIGEACRALEIRRERGASGVAQPRRRDGYA